jgi:sterol desaturase/sphingolipid hydroxylase (fatty acid hydroxylase superfamily)
MEIVRSKEPIRLFKSDFLEFFTHIHPAVVVAIWLPTILILLTVAIVRRPLAGFPFYLPVGFVIGLALWTLVEYTLHRFVFHFRPRTPRQERLSFIFHGVHHAQPMSKTRLVMPPALSIPMSLFFYGLFWLIVSVVLGKPHWLSPVFAGILSGYLTYDMLHYATHHWKVEWGWFRYIRHYHLRHHTQTPNRRFGVTSPFWDIVFGTTATD